MRAAEHLRQPTSEPYSLGWVRRHLGHYCAAPAFSRLHHDLAADLAAASVARGARLNYQAPRESAKTTVGDVGYALYGAVEGREPFTLLLSETGDQAAINLAAIRAELEDNPSLAAAYPTAVGRGPVWKTDRLVLRNGCCLMARGSGGRIRGLKHGRHRPTLVILDDANELADAYSPTTRRRKLDWLQRDVMSVGGPTTNFVDLGTPIHRDAIVCHLARNPVWQTRTYRGIVRWPDRADLWAEWERLLTNLNDPDRLHTARAFYDARRADMDAGAEVLWPGWKPLYDLMVRRADIGVSAFNSEQMDQPGTEGAAEWDAALFDRPDLFFTDWPEGVRFKVQTLDPSKGAQAKAGDYQAHVLLALGPKETGNCLYCEAHLLREPDYVARMLDLAGGWMPEELFAESNSTMGLLEPEVRRQLAERRKAGRPVPAKYVEADSREAKLYRVRRRLDTYLRQGRLKVRNTPGGRLLVEQLRDFPSGEHDDGPDALAAAVWRLEELVSGR